MASRPEDFDYVRLDFSYVFRSFKFFIFNVSYIWVIFSTVFL
ncbi:hypothetical protein F383_30170 [Gossypium arboreum]|uniref:Uncharacterized protein n=1 Tax=Gossypium arboreum TaxID=29729 RepID=A0A0B0MVT7_GOSAR|nr:hypothetical protein F383_30170 [Gossypium arboreum]